MAIVWEIQAIGREVPYVDVLLSIQDDGAIGYRTYRMELNTYQYLAATSCHPRSCFTSLVRGEAHRLLNTNKKRQDALHQLDFFAKKLERRGYNRTKVHNEVLEVWQT